MQSKQTSQIPRKQVHLFLPSPNLKFSNELRMSKMMVPHPTNITLQSPRMQRCHDLKKKKDCQSLFHSDTKDKKITSFRFSDKGLTISVGNYNKKIRGNLQIRYNRRYSHQPHNSLGQQSKTVDLSNIPITARQYLQRIKNQPSRIEQLKSLNWTLKQKQSTHINQQQKIVRMSISRMLQNSNDRTAFDYLTKFYKKPIQRELAVKKTKKQTNNINQILNVAELRPVSHQYKLSGRSNKTGETRCRCARNTIQVEKNRLNKTSHICKRVTQRSPQVRIIKKPGTTDSNQRKGVVLSLPQNWTVDSWNTQNKYFQDNSSALQKIDFKQ